MNFKISEDHFQLFVMKRKIQGEDNDAGNLRFSVKVIHMLRNCYKENLPAQIIWWFLLSRRHYPPQQDHLVPLVERE